MERKQVSRKKPIEEGVVSTRDLAIQRLSVREYGSGEMRSYLIRKGAPPEEATEVVAELVGDKLIDDERYARVIARHQAFRDKGPSYVLARLRQKGVRLPLTRVRAIYQETLPEQLNSELDLARRLVDRRYPRAHEDRDELRRAYGALVRRGFSREVAQKVLFRAGRGEEASAEEEPGED